jgi:hypothetical protein
MSAAIVPCALYEYFSKSTHIMAADSMLSLTPPQLLPLPLMAEPELLPSLLGEDRHLRPWSLQDTDWGWSLMPQVRQFVAQKATFRVGDCDEAQLRACADAGVSMLLPLHRVGPSPTMLHKFAPMETTLQDMERHVFLPPGAARPYMVDGRHALRVSPRHVRAGTPYRLFVYVGTADGGEMIIEWGDFRIAAAAAAAQ